jgi:hypothetical protein
LQQAHRADNLAEPLATLWASMACNRDIFTFYHVSACDCCRKLFEDEMSDCVLKSQIYKYSSYKVLTLLEVLRTAMPKETLDDDSGGSVDELSDDYVLRILACEKKMKSCAIVFVERRFTAKILCLVLKVRDIEILGWSNGGFGSRICSVHGRNYEYVQNFSVKT